MMQMQYGNAMEYAAKLMRTGLEPKRQRSAVAEKPHSCCRKCQNIVTNTYASVLRDCKYLALLSSVKY